MPRVIFFTTKQDLYFRLLIVDISNYNILYFFTNFLFLTWIVRIKYSKEEYYTNVVPKKKRRINGKIRNLIKKIDLTFWRQDELLLITSLVINPKKKKKRKKKDQNFWKKERNTPNYIFQSHLFEISWYRRLQTTQIRRASRKKKRSGRNLCYFF